MAKVATSGPDFATLKFWDIAAMKTTAERTRIRMERRIFDEGRAADGSPFPEGVDLVDSGAFRRSFSTNVKSADEASIGPDVAYAADLDERYGWAGLTTETQAELDAIISQAVDAALERTG